MDTFKLPHNRNEVFMKRKIGLLLLFTAFMGRAVADGKSFENGLMDTPPVAATPLPGADIQSTPIESTPIECTPIESTPIESTPIESTPIEGNPAPAPTPVPQPTVTPAAP